MRNPDRRSVLAGMTTAGLATAAVAATGSTALARGRSLFFTPQGQRLGLQLSSLGSAAGSDVDATFAKVAEIGFREIELATLAGGAPSQLAAAAKRAGISIVSVHLPLMALGGANSLSMLSEPARIADTLGTLGAHWAVAPILLIPAGFRPQKGEGLEAAIARTVAAAGEDIWKQTAEVLNRKGQELRQVGVGVAYHNHNLDFAPIGKTSGWEILFQETQPGLVQFEVDIGWVELAGIDPVAFLRKARGRIRLLHVRDMAESQPRGFRIAMGSPPVGRGRLDWARILPAARAAGARHFLVEQETAAGMAPFEAVKASFDFLARVRT